MRLAAILLTAICPALLAQPSAELPGCEPRPEITQAIGEKLSEQTLASMPFTAQTALRRQVLEGLIARYPREVEPHRQLLQSTFQMDTGRYQDLVEQYRRQAAQHPRDPLALYLAGLALADRDTPRSIQYLEQARADAPRFPWPALRLAQTYSSGKRVDKTKGGENLAAFFSACPASGDRDAQRLLVRDGAKELQARVAAALRVQLAAETEPKRLEAYTALWTLEFRAHPPQEHDAERQQVAADLKRLETLHPQPSPDWLLFLIKGYRQSGAPPDTVTAVEDRLIQSFPHSDAAFEIVSKRWDKDHPEPEDRQDAAAWAAFSAVYEEAVKNWKSRFTESRYLQSVVWFYAVSDDPNLTPAEGLRAMDALLAIQEYQQPASWIYSLAASFLIDRRWQPERALDLLSRAEVLMLEERSRRLSDNSSVEQEEREKETVVFRNLQLAALVLKAAKLANHPAAAEHWKTAIEGEPPKDGSLESDYWLNRARLAELESRKADALAYYQKALDVRTRAPEPQQGKLKDDLTAEARELWKEMGGTETAWNVWSKPPANMTRASADGNWEKPGKAMPAFELPDLSGKIWRVKNLEGKSVLINVWATWCGPCQAELPELEKLYERVKNRPDIQILTFDVDHDLGAVAPFVKEKGYTFPVLPAYSLVLNLMDGVNIPQNWILDPAGVWRWRQLGFDSEEGQWADRVVRRLESVKTSAP